MLSICITLLMWNLRQVWNICSLNTPLSDILGFPCRRKHGKPGCKGGNAWLGSIMQLIPASNIFDSVIDFLLHCFANGWGSFVLCHSDTTRFVLTVRSPVLLVSLFSLTNLDSQMFSSMSRFTVVSPGHKQTSNIYCHVITHTIVGMYWENRSITVSPHWYEEEMWLRHLAL